MGGVSASFRYPRRWIVCGSLPVVTAGLLILFVSVTISSGVLLDGRRASLGLRRAPSDRTGILNSLRRFNSANGNQGDSHADDGNDAERVWSLYGFSQIGQSGSQGGRKRSGASGKGKSSGIFSKARISRLGLKRKVELPSGTQGSYKKLESPAGAVGTATPPPPKEDDVSLVERIGVTSVGEEVKTGDDSDSSPGDSYGFFQAGASDARSRAAGLWRRLMKAYRKRKRETAALARGAAQTLRRASSRLSDRVRSRLSSVASPTSLVPPEGFPDTGRTPTSPRRSTSVLVATGQGTAETPEARSQELTLASPPLSPVFYSTGFENFEPPREIPECTLRPDLEVLREGQKNLHLAETALTANSEVDPNLQEALDSVLPPNQRVPVRSRDGSTGVLRQTAFVRKNRDTLEVLVTLTPDNSESEQLFSATFVYRTETAGTSEDQMQGQAESILHRQITGDETVGLAAHTDVQLLRRIGVGLTSGVYRVAPDADMFARAPGPVATGPHIYRRLTLRPPTRMRLSEVDQRLLSAEGLQYVVYSILQMVGALNDLRFVLSSISLEDFGIHPLTGQIFLIPQLLRAPLPDEDRSGF
ncbi:hypothetical protein CSUI_005865 [Cystoisospora suis]|uniref:Transmembrane protein n=1 Tax=Cystoisospora suis TaxID=483139 RepID=A0A2C6KW29_9APIC|nr:hypothetical protein CSUI_005865 [Cystoisospora suis]